MKCLIIFTLLCFCYSFSQAQQTPQYAVFCFAEKNLAGNYVVFLTSSLANYQGCCLGGSSSVTVFANINHDSIDTVVYIAENCPPQARYYPLTCYRGNTQCQATGFTTRAIGEAAVQECCGTSGTMTASFHLAQIGNVCITCFYPAPSQSQLNQARARINSAPRGYSPANVCVLVGFASLAYLLGKKYNEWTQSYILWFLLKFNRKVHLMNFRSYINNFVIFLLK